MRPATFATVFPSCSTSDETHNIIEFADFLMGALDGIPWMFCCDDIHCRHHRDALISCCWTLPVFFFDFSARPLANQRFLGLLEKFYNAKWSKKQHMMARPTKLQFIVEVNVQQEKGKMSLKPGCDWNFILKNSFFFLQEHLKSCNINLQSTILKCLSSNVSTLPFFLSWQSGEAACLTSRCLAV